MVKRIHINKNYSIQNVTLAQVGKSLTLLTSAESHLSCKKVYLHHP